MKLKKFDIYKMVTDLIVDRLQAGVVPWQMPWKSSGAMPRNMVSKKPYRGINFWYLLSFGFENPFFLTFNQIKELGGSVKRGSKSFQVVFWKMVEYEKEGGVEKMPYLRYYRIFHIDSVQGIDPAKIPADDSHDHEFDPISKCEELLQCWEDSPFIEWNRPRACYIPSLDKIQVPSPRTFYKDEQYYSTIYHECIHSTGHRKRLNRHERFPDHKFGSRDYSQEELVAEMGAAFLCGICGIENATIDNSAAYIQSWLNKLKNDKHFIVQAASHAQRAVDYILEHQQKIVVPEAITSKEEATPVSFSI